MNQTDVCIVGAGIIGLASALGLSKRGHHVVVLDANSIKADETYPDSRVYAINLASITFFKALGVWPFIENKRKAPYAKMTIWDEATQAHIEFDAKEIAKPKLGDMIEERIIKAALLEAISHESLITLMSEAALIEMNAYEEGVFLKTTQGEIKAQLLAVADGAQSKTRQSLGVSLTSWPYHHTAIVASVCTTKPHQETAYQIFKSTGPLAFLPMSKSHDSSIVWSTSKEEAIRLMALNHDEFNQELTNAFEHRLGQVTLLNERIQFPLIMRHAKTYVGERWLLLGDAAHTIHPLAGLGLNVGLQDIYDWLNYQDEMQLKPWDTKVLKAYSRKRQHDVWQMIVLMDTLKSIFGQSFKGFQFLRALGLTCVNRLGIIKRQLIRFATGEST